MKQIVLTGLENKDKDIKSVSMTSLKSEGDLIKDFPKCSDKSYEEHDIDIKCIAYNREASAIKLAKLELQQLFETIKKQTHNSKKLFNSTFVDNERVLSDISDEEENSNVSNFMSVVTHSSC